MHSPFCHSNSNLSSNSPSGGFGLGRTKNLTAVGPHSTRCLATGKNASPVWMLSGGWFFCALTLFLPISLCSHMSYICSTDMFPDRFFLYCFPLSCNHEQKSLVKEMLKPGGCVNRKQAFDGASGRQYGNLFSEWLGI